jgi:hypothetical protein
MSAAAQLPIPVPSATLPTGPDDAAGPFVSGTVHKCLRLGQRLSAADLVDDMESDDGPVTVGRKFGGTHAAVRRQALSGSAGPGAGTGVRGGASLWDLVEAGVLVPGRGKISVAYKGASTTATLTDDGCIEYQGRKYQSATAFSIHFKRTITPSKQGDDGWKSVLYDGRPLEHFRHVHSVQLRQAALAAAKADEGGAPGEEGAPPAAAPPAAPAAAAAAAAAAAERSPAEPPSAGALPPKPSKAASAAKATPKPPRPPGKAAGSAPRTAKGPGSAAKAAPRSTGARGGGKRKSAAAAAAARADSSEDEEAEAPLTIDGQVVVELGPEEAGLEPSDQWVQCERCKTWRLVPNEWWPAVRDDASDEWRCEDAKWALTKSHPFTAACKKR